MYPTIENIKEIAAKGQYKRVPVCREVYADRYTPVEVMRTLRKASRHCYLLESASQTEVWGRYSFLGYEPTMEITCTDGTMKIRWTGDVDQGEITKQVVHPGDALREILKEYKSPVMEDMPPFTGGMVGYFSYDYIKYSEPKLKLGEHEDTDFRDMDLMLFDQVIAAGGVPVAKHGNRAASSKSGAADVLEALGVNITIPPEKSAELLKKINICFLFAQNYHIAMKYVAPIRKELGIRTVFNILGPLSNPAGANMELMGVFDQALVEPLAQVMAKLGVTKGMVVFGQDKLDEISMSAPTSVCEIKDGWFQSYEITPEQFGYTRCSKDDLVGGTPAENAEITKAILKGEEKGAKRQAVCLNAGAALYIAGKADTMEAGVRMAEELIDSGAALKKLEEFIHESND